MPTDWPSSSGMNRLPQSSTMWCTALSASGAVRRKLPATVALIGCFRLYRLRYGCAADQGAVVDEGDAAALT